MKLPNIWGGGALFAYSGLDGYNHPKKSLCGWLCADRIGISFNSGRLDMVTFLEGIHDVQYEIVASDILRIHFDDDRVMTVVFAAHNTVLGYLPKGAWLNIVTMIPRATANGCTFYTNDEEHFCVVKQPLGEGCRFALSYSADSCEEAEHDARTALKTDENALARERIAFYENLSAPEGLTDMQERTLAKCFSIMRSQVYAPQEKYAGFWTTPDRLPHRHLWLWDSVFHSLGNVYISPELAKDSIRAIFASQAENGFIPHAADLDYASDITQPPVIAWGVWKLYEKTNDRAFLAETYANLRRYLLWNRAYRDDKDNDLYEWQINPNNPHCRCDECGMDNSPRFDEVQAMDCVDFSAYMANEARCMAKIAAVLQNGEAAFWLDWYQRICNAVNGLLWDEQDGYYYDRVVKDGSLKKVQAVSCFLPLFAGICSEAQAARLVAHLRNPAEFHTAMGIPSLAKTEPTFGTDMWRGPVWLNFNYMIAEGLRAYGFADDADWMIHSTVDAVSQWYEADGVIYEFYDCENRKSPSRMYRKGETVTPYAPFVRMQAVRDYGWTATLFTAMLKENRPSNNA